MWPWWPVTHTVTFTYPLTRKTVVDGVASSRSPAITVEPDHGIIGFLILSCSSVPPAETAAVVKVSPDDSSTRIVSLSKSLGLIFNVPRGFVKIEYFLPSDAASRKIGEKNVFVDASTYTAVALYPTP